MKNLQKGVAQFVNLRVSVMLDDDDDDDGDGDDGGGR
jgi:hypothetical protein